MENKVRITPILTGHFSLPRGAFFGVAESVVTRHKFKDHFEIDDHDRVVLTARGLLVRTPDGIFIVEPGLGSKSNEYADKYCDTKRRQWSSICGGAGFKLKDVSGVLTTHLHWDHAGGNIKVVGEKLLPTFPNATYFIHRLELQHATNKDWQRLTQSYDPQDIPPSDQIKIIEPIKTEVAPHIWMEHTGGHSPGHCVIHIEGDDQHHVFMGDIAPTYAHLTSRGGYEMAFDDDARMVLVRKRSLIRRAKEENWRLWLVHDPKILYVDGKDLK